MELNDLKTMWQANEARMEKTIKLNQRFIELMQVQKVRSEVVGLCWQRIIEIFFHSVSLVFLLWFLVNNFNSFSYAASGILLLTFYLVLFIGCLKQIFILKRMDYSNDIVSLQSSLVILRTNIVNYARLVVLCIPAFLAYPVVLSKAFRDLNITLFGDFDVVAKSHGSWWTAQIIATIVLIPLGIWVYRQLTYKNIHLDWVSSFIQHATGRKVRKSMEFLSELESLRADVK